MAVSGGDKIISIHVPRERDDLLHLHGKQLLHISIHVPRERDDARLPEPAVQFQISIHVPRERDDLIRRAKK